nr:putative acyl-CoA N-acyltransferase [Ipomoea batatas]
MQAEVLAGLIHRLRNSPPDRYACLVAEASKEGSEFKEVVGVVDATVYRDNDVLRHLPAAADEYLYISGIAVLHKFRRQKVATALLKACEMVANLWGLEYLVLRAYEDDWGARKLYSNAGYRVVSTDPPWRHGPPLGLVEEDESS